MKTRPTGCRGAVSVSAAVCTATFLFILFTGIQLALTSYRYVALHYTLGRLGRWVSLNQQVCRPEFPGCDLSDPGETVQDLDAILVMANDIGSTWGIVFDQPVLEELGFSALGFGAMDYSNDDQGGDPDGVLEDDGDGDNGSIGEDDGDKDGKGDDDDGDPQPVEGPDDAIGGLTVCKLKDTVCSAGPCTAAEVGCAAPLVGAIREGDPFVVAGYQTVSFMGTNLKFYAAYTGIMKKYHE